MVIPFEIKNQKGKPDFCTGCVVASIAEPYVGEPCDESFSFAMGKKVSGDSPTEWGQNPKHAMRGAIEFGVLPKRFSPFTDETPREILANPKSWEAVMQYALRPFGHYKGVSNPKLALQGKTTLMAGLFWQGEWDSSPYIVSQGQNHKLAPHEVRVIGYEHGWYVLQNSRGVNIGNGGLWYLKEEIPFAHLYQLSTEASLFHSLLNKLNL